ncbi:IclR family transcriptional regulator [Rhodococcus sp. 05-2256-B2]|nr:IclR family transcriptional regulator [Rhodococcus sp. 05-2256-B4]OZD92945.1 IclR family transcriptional regulator [Rhodococcus sp. 05-2256-B2]OZD95606.1 IclR family transcriptional regulator [Rhodococcus sp. 05-2256-B3]OZD95968.1 IclR family transcriptional regulator [Rhodococcus sp. 05-2256-B1]
MVAGVASDDSTRAPEGGVQSVDRAFRVLEVVARLGEAGVSAIATEIGVHKSTVSRLLASLEEHDMVMQTHNRGKYRLSLGVLRLAAAVPERLEITEYGHAVCERLAGKLGETVNIAVLRSNTAVHLDQARGPSSVGTHNWIGEQTPLHATASGKVLLAALDSDTRQDVVDGLDLHRYTEHTLTTKAGLTAELDAAVSLGYAVVVEEFETGLNAIAAPILDYTGKTTAALSISGPVYRFDETRMRAIVPDVLAAAAEISEKMCYRESFIPSA